MKSQPNRQAALRAEYATLKARQADAINREVWHLAESLGGDLERLSTQIQWTDEEIQSRAHDFLLDLATLKPAVGRGEETP